MWLCMWPTHPGSCCACKQVPNFIPAELAQVLNDATERVKEKSCYALESFCENLGDDIVPFLEPLLSRLSELLKAGSRKTQEMCVSAIASVCAAGWKAAVHPVRGRRPICRPSPSEGSGRPYAPRSAA